MELTPSSTLHGFTVVRNQELPEIDGTAVEFRHQTSGARLLYLKNDDNNKAFAIGFRTPPKDDTGVFHILEHSVLCGSRKFPVKEPFVNLLRGSMQTFLNAMTYPDKTLYPVSSTNEQDLFNLMDVYMDAVFHPNIYQKRGIFQQEGWHYELTAREEGADAAALSANETTLVYNGVVYNEMKGALSDASSVLLNEIQRALFPHTCYAFESGGTPEAIPTLTYEEFLNEHRRHYRTQNSYLFLYGNVDISRALEFLDERYLTPVEAEQREFDNARERDGLEPLVPRVITDEKPHVASHIRTTMDTAAENACSACAYVIGNAKDCVRTTGVQILLDALFGSNEAPLKRALLDDKVAHDVRAYVSESTLQPYAIVQLQIPAPGAGEALGRTLAEKTRALIEKGLDHNLIEAALSNAEFHMREHDFGISDGVIYAMSSLANWLYDDDAATEQLRYEPVFAELRKNLEGDFFEQLALELFCTNNFWASAEVVPTPGQSDDKTAERLAQKNAGLSAPERQHIVDEEALLRQMQAAPDSPEAVAALPHLSINDIGDVPQDPAYLVLDDAPLPCVRHTVPTRGIVYCYRYYDMSVLSFEDLPYVSVLANLLSRLDTKEHTAAQLDTLIQGKLGNLSFFPEALTPLNPEEPPLVNLVVSSSALPNKVEWLATLPNEIILHTDFSDSEKILDILKQRKIILEQSFINSGHSCATSRARSYYSSTGVVTEQLTNVGFYQFLCQLIDEYDQRADDLRARLEDLAAKLFCDDRCLLGFTGTDEAWEQFWKANPCCGRTGNLPTALQIPQPQKKNEGFIIPSDVCYAGYGWNQRLMDITYSGTWQLAGRMLSYDYLWNEVRVKGGAYGVGFSASQNGDMRYYSFRDPHLDETIQRFQKAAAWLASSEPSVQDFEGFVVATTAKIDAPCKAREIIRRQMNEYLKGIAPDTRLKRRGEVLQSTMDDVHALAPYLEQLDKEHALCVFGSKDILENSNQQLQISTLIG